MLPLYTLLIQKQRVWLFDLDLNHAARSQRQAVLDKVLSQFFQSQLAKNTADFWQNFDQFVCLLHTPGHPAQAIFLDHYGKKVHLTLAISYALPFVAVALSLDKIGLDLCEIAAFTTMTDTEKYQFCHDYFPQMPATLDNSTLAKRWSLLESGVKYQQITLAQAIETPLFLQNLATLTTRHQKILLKNHEYWLTLMTDFA